MKNRQVICSIPKIYCIVCDKAYSDFTSCAVDFAKDDPNRYPWGVDFERFQSSSLEKAFCDQLSLVLVPKGGGPLP
uniref:Uncharacterized protein n=1 Tax=Romanomermis culicivorax TaxID=13658 RepID=A0A915K3H1_ROMCU